MNGTGEKPSGVIAVPLIVGGVRGWTKPHTLLRRIANTFQAQAARGERHAHDAHRAPIGARARAAGIGDQAGALGDELRGVRSHLS